MGQTALSNLVEAQLTAVDAFLNGKTNLPSGSLAQAAESGGASTATPADPFAWKPTFHFDLNDAAAGG
jgi:hypothetical protein